ncbi:hypothetical protein OBV_25430 [Oscillibacter valericigenes Sjm18-20]|nr:hypothetical protein OBV_25430 [Oscillibacter valericigenes Sjm18-20]
MSITRKIARRMAKAQMKKDGIQHPCRQYNKPGTIAFGHAGAGKTSYFAAHWREATARRQAELPRTRKRKPPHRATSCSGIIQSDCQQK